MKKILTWTAIVIIVLLLMLVSFGRDYIFPNAVDFVNEQQPGAKSLGDLIGKQYSQLRRYSTALDAQSCKIQINEAAYEDLKNLNQNQDESLWSELNQKEAANLRLEHRTLLAVYADVASKYNNLASDIRTFVDEAGLKIKDIPEVEEVSPIPGMCNGFEKLFPELPTP